MNLLNTINKLGHCLRAVIKPVNIVLAVATIAAAMSIGEVQGQNNNFKNTNMEVTETGYGELFIKNENNNPVANAKSTWTPVDVPGDSIPNPYVYFSDNAGTINYEVLVFHDTGVGIQNNYHIEVVQARPNPSTDFTFNFFANERPNNSIQINSINGALIGRYGVTDYNNHVAIYHVDLSDKADGIYTATTTIDGEPHFSKIVKVNGSYSGNLGSSAKEVPPIEPINKSVLVNEAIYDVSIEAEGYYTLTDQRTVVVDENDIGVYTLISNEAPPIDNQDLSGIVTNTNTGNPINNALIEVEVVSSGQLYNATSSSDGSFTVNGLPLGEDILFRAGGVTGKYSISNFPNETISEITNPADSVNAEFNVSLPNHLPTSTTLAHAKDQNLSGTNQDTTCFI